MKPNKFYGAVLLIIAAFFLALYSAFIFAAKDYMSSSLITCLTCFFGFIFLLVPVFYMKFENLKSNDIPAVLVRGIGGGLAFLCFVTAIRLVNLVDAVVLFNATPIFVPIIALFYTRTKITPLLWIPIIIGFIGIIFIVQPDGQMFHNPGELVALLAGIFLSFALIAVRKLVIEGMPVSGIVFYFYFFATLVSLPFALYNFEYQTAMGFWYVFLGSISLTIVQFAFSYAYKFATPAEVGPYWYLSILFSGLFGYFIWGQELNLWKFIGIIIVVGAGIATFFINRPSPLKHRPSSQNK